MLQMQRIYKLVEERELRQAEAVALRSAYNREQRQQNLDAILRAEHRETVKAPPPQILEVNAVRRELVRVRSEEAKARRKVRDAEALARENKHRVFMGKLPLPEKKKRPRAEGTAWAAVRDRLEARTEAAALVRRTHMSNATLSKDEE